MHQGILHRFYHRYNGTNFSNRNQNSKRNIRKSCWRRRRRHCKVVGALYQRKYARFHLRSGFSLILLITALKHRQTFSAGGVGPPAS